MKRKTKKRAEEKSEVAVDLGATDSVDSLDRGAGSECERAPSPAPGGRGLPLEAEASEPAAQRAAATKRTRSEILRDYWRDVKAGRRTRNNEPREVTKDPDRNPLLDLPDVERSKLFVLLRECPHTETVNLLLGERGVPAVTTEQLDEFFREQAIHHWEMRALRATTEADALIRHAEENLPKLSAGILSALAQEAFRQITRDNADPVAMGRIAVLFMKARGDNRAHQMQELKRQLLQSELEDKVGQAYAKLAEEVQGHPAAQEAFEALRRELAEDGEDEE